jgi:hypothetical protein
VETHDKAGNVTETGNLTFFLLGGGVRWIIGKFDAETGSNSGSDWAFQAFHDDGTFAGAPLFIQRSNKRVGFMQTSPAGALHVSSTDAATPVLIGDGAFSQSADLLQLRNSGGTPQFAVDSAGNATMGLIQKFHDASQVISGTGTPEGVVTAIKGSLFRRVDGSAGTILYVKESGTGNTGWVAYSSGGLLNIVTAATKTKVTYNAQGLITAGAAADLSGTDVTGTLAAARMPAFTGEVTSPGGGLVLAINLAYASAYATSALTLSTSVQDVPGATLSLANGVWDVTGNFVFNVGSQDATASGFLVVGGVTQSFSPQFSTPNSTPSLMTVAFRWPAFTVAGGPLTVKLQAVKTGLFGTGTCATGTTIVATKIG